jgi:hypothetical protein
MTATDRLFAKQLPGETGPTQEQVSDLVRASAALLKEAPWEYGLGDRQMIAVDMRGGEERGYCIFLGTNREVFGMNAYIGDRGFASYKWLMEHVDSAGLEYLAQLHAVSVEFVSSAELKPADRQALRGAWPNARGLKPQFRAWRPGFYPWFPNEQETVWLNDCVDAAVALLSETNPKIHRLWQNEQSLPLMTWRDGVWQQGRTEPPQPRIFQEVSALPDPGEVEARRNLPRKGILQATHMYLGATVGKAHERRSMLTAALVVDAKTGFIFSPELGTPDRIAGEMLNDAVLRAIAARESRPDEVHVWDRRISDALQPLAKALGFRVKVASSTPALDAAVEGLTQFLAAR